MNALTVVVGGIWVIGALCAMMAILSFWVGRKAGSEQGKMLAQGVFMTGLGWSFLWFATLMTPALDHVRVVAILFPR